MNALSDLATTPEGLILLSVGGFVLLTLLVTGLIFFVSSLVRRKTISSNTPAVDPLESFSRQTSSDALHVANTLAINEEEASNAPIALARLRAMTPDPTQTAEPRLPSASSAASSGAPDVRRQTTAAATTGSNASATSSTSNSSSSLNSLSATVTTPPSETAAPEPTPSAFHTVATAPTKPDPFASANFLMTLPFERRANLSLAHADICGMGIEAVFFDPEMVSRWNDDALRLVPFLPEGAKLLQVESDRNTFHAGSLFAQPDGVINVASGLIALEYKSRSGRLEDPLRWAETLRTKDLLQTLLGALALSANSGRPVAPVLRTQNAVYYLRPTPELRQLIVQSIDTAAEFLGITSAGAAPEGISASDCAALLAPAVERCFPRPESSLSALGREAHSKLLTRRQNTPL